MNATLISGFWFLRRCGGVNRAVTKTPMFCLRPVRGLYKSEDLKAGGNVQQPNDPITCKVAG